MLHLDFIEEIVPISNIDTVESRPSFSAYSIGMLMTILIMNVLIPSIRINCRFIFGFRDMSELCPGQSLKCKMNKGQLLKNKTKQSLDNFALHFYPMRSICLRSFMLIFLIVSELCPGQSSKCLFLFSGFKSHRHSKGHIATFQLYWWRKTSGALRHERAPE
jgi:hypothetical protein